MCVCVFKYTKKLLSSVKKYCSGVFSLIHINAIAYIRLGENVAPLLSHGLYALDSCVKKEIYRERKRKRLANQPIFLRFSYKETLEMR